MPLLYILIASESHRRSYLKECMNFEVKIGGKTCNFLGLYRSPSQNKAEFENFIKNLELNWNTLQTKAYNAKMQGWY